MQKITTFLWFDDNAEEAANFYVSVFKNAKITNISHYPEGGPAPVGSVMMVSFELAGQEYTALNAGPEYKFTPAISLVVHCDDQAEVDYYWSRLTSDGGEEVACGWLTDKYGLSWQITPVRLLEMVTDPDPVKSGRAMQAMMQMKKIEIDKIEEAFAG